MKKKLILTVLIALVAVCLFAVSASATTIYKDTTVTLSGSFTVGDATVTNPVVNLYDEQGYALVWYLNLDNKLVSERAVNLITVTSNKAKFKDVSIFYGKSQQKGVVVVNLRDDFVNDGLTGIQKFDSNFQFGYYGAKKTPPIQYFYFPVTATEIIPRMFQNTQLIIADIEPGTPIATMGAHAVTMTNLKEFFVPNDLTAFVEQDDVGVFQETPIERITFEEGSQIKVIPYRCFYLCKNLEELVLPNSVEEIHQRALQLDMFGSTAALKKLVFGDNFKSFKSTNNDYYYVRGTSALKEVYLPASFNAENTDTTTAYQLFTLCPNAVFYYCGTEEAWDEVIAKIPLNKTNETGNDANGYIKDAKANNKVVFNYSACLAFYNGTHVENDTANGNACYLAECKNCGVKSVDISSATTHNYEEAFVYTNYFANGAITKTCQNANCVHSASKTPAIDNETLKPLFKELVYSTKEDGAAFGIYVEYKIDQTAIALYEELSGKSVSYGVMAIKTSNITGNGPLNVEGKTSATNVIAANVTASNLKTAKLIITGNWADNADIEITMLGYVTDGSELHYMGSQTVEDKAVATTGAVAGAFNAVTYNNIIE